MKQSGYYGVDGKWRPKDYRNSTRINPLDPRNHATVHQTKTIRTKHSRNVTLTSVLIKMFAVMLLIFWLLVAIVMIVAQ